MKDTGSITAKTVYSHVFDFDSFNTSNFHNAQRTPSEEKDRIEQTLQEQHGNVSKTAAELGIARDTLYRKMKKYGIHLEK